MSVIHHSRHGYIFLVTVLVIGVVASATATSLLLLGWAAEQNGLLIVQTNQAYEYAQTCMERSLYELRTDLSYAGDTTVTFSSGTCEIAPVGGNGNENRTICITGFSGDSVRRLEMDIAQVYPSVRIRSWQEVAGFSLCN